MCTVSVTVERDNPSVESTLSLQKCCAGLPQTSGTKKKKGAEGRAGKRGRSKEEIAQMTMHMEMV